MKLNTFKSTFLILSGLALGACSEGQYWDEPSNPGKVFAFEKPAETISIPANDDFPSTIDVVVSRNSNEGEATVPVTFTSSDDLITGPASVTFANGSYTATYTISLADGLFAGVNYTASIDLDQPKDAMVHVKPENLSYTLRISKVLVLDWQPAGTAAAMSDWGQTAAPVDIAIEVATNYPSSELRICRMISPYKSLDPGYTPDDANLEFFIDNDGNAAGMASAWQYMGQNDDEEGYYFFGCPANYGCSFTNEGDIYTMDGIVATGPTLTGTPSPGWYETITFKWDAPVRE